MNEPQEPALDPALPIIDPHHHLWTEPPLKGYTPYTIDYLADEILRSGHNVVASVYNDSLVGYRTSGPEHLRVVGEVEQVEKVVRDYANRGGKIAGLCAGIVGTADMTMGSAIEEVLDEFVAISPRFRGIRHMTAFAEELPNWGSDTGQVMLRPSFKEGLAALARRKLTFDAWLFQDQLLELVEIANAMPDLPIILNHMGGPRGTGRYQDRLEDALADWSSGLKAVAACRNVAIKLGGMNIVTTGMIPPGGPAASSQAAAALHRRHMLTAIDLFGPDRCMFESNAPIDTQIIPYSSLWNSFKLITADFSSSDRKKLFSGTAATVYDIHLPSLS
jgi:L-fuconolactonase